MCLVSELRISARASHKPAEPSAIGASSKVALVETATAGSFPGRLSVDIVRIVKKSDLSSKKKMISCHKVLGL